ncbi:MAG: hypothetical protein EOO94_02490, partial [Pedobacter sp.]
MARFSNNQKLLLYYYRHLLPICMILFCVNTISAQKPLFDLLPSRQTGISFNNTLNESENLNVMAYEYFYNGGGVAVGDLNN